MVIQRWQSVFLLLAAAAMGAFGWLPFGIGVNGGEELILCPADGYVATLATALAAAAFFLADIFLFRTFKAQKAVLAIAMLCTLATAILGAYYNIAAATNGYSVTWAAGCWVLVVAVILGFQALKAIRHDERLLKSADRLR